jgi:hypothetical protein
MSFHQDAALAAKYNGRLKYLQFIERKEIFAPAGLTYRLTSAVWQRNGSGSTEGYKLLLNAPILWV